MPVRSGTTPKSNPHKPSQVIKSTHGTRKIRCHACQNLAVATTDGKGGTVWKCLGCGRVYSFSPM